MGITHFFFFIPSSSLCTSSLTHNSYFLCIFLNLFTSCTVRVRDLFINKNQSTAVQTIFCTFEFQFNGRTLKSGVSCVRTCLPMDIIIYANVQILYNVKRNEEKMLTNGNSNSYDDSKCISKTCTTLTSIVALNGHGKE